MLHKSFKASKCKTSLKLATARLKLMKNKKGVQMNQMKKDLAQLLESGQDRTARIRVEHFIREEKMVAAYDLIELYCELIAARLPIIESQKNCPMDLKEAITSVIFASPRCADVPELLDVKKHFTAKYGKEFVTAALELRPNSGVGRMLVEKLSAVAPDGQAKLKVLNAIAEEHNIKWDPKSFEEKETKPVNDLLDGPSPFEKASEMTVEAPKVGTSNVQVTSSHDRHARPLNVTEINTISSTDAHNVLPTNHGGRNTNAATHPDLRYSGNETKEVRHSLAGDDNSSSRQDSYLEFKDAMSAAQAAAESAERASMAARAAAELSRRENKSRQYSSEPQNSSIRHERPGIYAASELAGQHFGNVPGKNSTFHNENSMVQNELIVGGEYQNRVEAGERFHTYDHGNAKISSHSPSPRSGESKIDDNTSVISIPKPHGHSKKNSFEETSKQQKEPLYSRIDTKKQYVKSRDENASRWKDDSRSEHFDQFGEATIEKQEHVSSSRSHSSNETEDYVVSNDNHQELGNNDANDLFLGFGQDNIYRDATDMNAYDDKSVAFDEYDSNDDRHSIDTGPKYDGESTSYIPSLGSNSPSFFSTTADTWNPRRDVIKPPEKATLEPHDFAEDQSSSLFSERSTETLDRLEPDNVSVTHDLDGPKFDSEDEVETSIHEGANSSSIFSHKQDVFSLDPEPAQSENYGSTESLFVNRKNTGYDKRPSVKSSSSDDLDSVEAHLKNNPVTVLNAESSNFDVNEYKQNVGQSSILSLPHRDEDSFHATGSPDTSKDEDLQPQFNSEEENKLNFGTLTGGLRNKGYRHPPYSRKPSGDPSSLTSNTTDKSSTIIEHQMPPPSVNTTLSTDAIKESSFSTSNLRSDSDSQTDDSGEEVQQKTSSERQAPFAKKFSKEVKYKSSFKPFVATYFDLDNDDYNEDIRNQNFPNRGHLGSAISRRTKPSHSITGTKSDSKIQAEHDALASPDSSKERTSTWSRHDTQNPTKLKSEIETTDYSNSKEQPSSTKRDASKAQVPRFSSREKLSNSSALEQPSSGHRNTGASSSLPNPKTLTLKGEPPSSEDSTKRASHIHPKLPDYDSIAAHLQSFRTDQQ